MIRGPVLPHLRESLWALVSSRLERIESGLTLVMEGLDCSDGQLGAVDGLARDAAGAPVLVLLAVEGDSLLQARALAAGQFLQRVGDALASAVPEANFRPGARGRLLLVGTDASAALLAQAQRLPLPSLQVCSLEPFRIAGSERFAVRWLTGASVEPDDASTCADAMEFVAPDARAEQWELLRSICDRIDPAVVLHGDRFSRRITWNGHLLGEVRVSEGALFASSVTGVSLDLSDLRDVRRFGDQLLRAFAICSGLDLSIAPSSPAVRPGPGPVDDRIAATRHAAQDRAATSNASAARGESLRTSLAAARLSPEEYSALEDPAPVAGSHNEGIVVAEDRKHASPSTPPSVDRD